ncbi:UDP-N-acetylglucosamine 2-epimerase, partial [Hydrogenivirga sp. 128-5-R1-1]|uniref:UDP-N-acetylglucosamine 2-epimerase n=1 Tax=Hydrogenivirga sp. 128-5-R1-1 TaxID=392423 RepID=UPI00015F05A0
FTGTRAEYGLLKPLMYEIKKDKDLELQIIASGMHLSPEFGLTYKEIEKDGFTIDEKVEMLLSSDTPFGISKSIGLGVIGYTDALERLKPDITVVLGDRFEALAFVIASFTLKIPIAHLYGGETTLGVLDEGYRHAITKLSYLHFTSTEEYKKRVIQLGEEPERVFNVGALGIDNIKKLKLLSKEEVEKRLGKKLKKRNLLITFHPETLKKGSSENQFKELLKALDELEDTLLIFTKANADTEGRKINYLIDEYASKNKEKTVVFTNMGQLLYLSTMQFVDAVVGNSSSGIIEAPSFKIGTINIGDRQKGRIRAESIIDCKPDYESIKKSINKLFSQNFRQKLKNVNNPYENKNTARKIKNILKSFELDNLEKKFFDIPVRY